MFKFSNLSNPEINIYEDEEGKACFSLKGKVLVERDGNLFNEVISIPKVNLSRFKVDFNTDGRIRDGKLTLEILPVNEEFLIMWQDI